jgi:hypothetical protein
VFEGNEPLKMTWAASSPHGINWQTLTVDGKTWQTAAGIAGPYNGLYYSCPIGIFSAGTHTYTIDSSDANSITSTVTGTFTVVPAVRPIVSDVVVAEAAGPRNGVFDAGEKLVITWGASTPIGIARQTLDLDGVTVTSHINGPYGGVYYSCQIGMLAAGIHGYRVITTDTRGVSTVASGEFTVVAPVPPAIASVVVAAAAKQYDNVLEPSEMLVITWAATSSLRIASQSVTVDGQAMKSINGPYGGLYYSCSIGTRAVGAHTYTITAVDSLGGSSTSTGTFNVATLATSVVVAEAGATKNGVLEANEPLKITWAASSHSRIATQTVMLDGHAARTINGPYGGLYYSCPIGTLAAGSHTYAITSTNSKGVSTTASGTFAVVDPGVLTLGDNGGGTLTLNGISTGGTLNVASIGTGTVILTGGTSVFSGTSTGCGINTSTINAGTNGTTSIVNFGTRTLNLGTTGGTATVNLSGGSLQWVSIGANQTYSGTLTVAAPLLVSASSSTTSLPDLLTEAQLAPIVAAAKERMNAQSGGQLDIALAHINFKIANLADEQLSERSQDTIWIDDDAAGRGWFVDATPGDDAEFAPVAGATSLSATDSAAAQRADLLTTVMHEMGHVLGYGDTSLDDLMGSMLPLGVRRDPNPV